MRRLNVAAAALTAGSPSADNVALGASVRMSSLCDVKPPHSPYPLSPKRLTDGKRKDQYDACTAGSTRPWVTVKLKQPAIVREVVIYGRHDCCWAGNTLPLVAELSLKGSPLKTVGRREFPFTRDEPWRIALAEPVVADTLRLRVDSKATAEIVLSEIELLGHLQE